MEIKTFVIRPVQRHSYQGRNLQRAVLKNTDTGTIVAEHTMQKTKAVMQDGQSCTDNFGFRRPEYNRNVYDAGLSEQVSNPFYESNSEKRDEAAQQIMTEYSLHEDWRKVVNSIVSHKTITKQQELEIRFLGSSPPGTLTEALPNERLRAHRGIIDPAAPRTFLMDFRLILFDRSNMFKTDNLRGCLAWQLATHHPKIAKGREYVNPAVHNWYIAEEYEDEKISMSLNNAIDEAIFRLVSLKRKYPSTEVLEENVVYQIFSLVNDTGYKPIFKGKVTVARLNELVDAYLKNKSNSDTLKFHLKSFNETLDLYETNPSLFYAKYLVQQGLNTNVFQINNSKVYWLSKKDTPEVYSFTSVSALEKFVFEEINAPESSYLPNLIGELDAKYAVIPKGLR